MCGILFTNDKNISTKQFKNSLLLMKHRGPDNQTVICRNGYYIGHNRLSILDLNARSNQPFKHESLHLIYNGEIYNYKELIKSFNLNVNTTSDTEVVLQMFNLFGPECLKYFNGMFAFIVYNENTNDIFVARDRLGIKPLYYLISGDYFIFSSEMEPILEIYPDEYDEFGIRQYKKLRMTVKNYTVYKNIKLFPPGHYWFNGRFTKYWDLQISDREPPSDVDLLDLISDAVSIRKRSDVPVGSYLSGGLDSTILSYLLEPSHTWTVGFKEFNEFKWGNIANNGLKSEHHQIVVDSIEFIENAKWMISKRKEPLSVPNEILLYIMTLEVKGHNTVVLSGEGADELFWGYDRIFKWAHKSKELILREFDEKYCYGTHQDDEVLDFALEGIPGKTVLDKIAYYFQVFHLHGLLRRLDNSTMLCSVEARVPFVDHRLVEMLAGCPYDWRVGRSFKEPLKRLFKEKIPKEIIAREKVGFPVDLQTIFQKTDKTPMDSWLDFNIEILTQSRKNISSHII